MNISDLHLSERKVSAVNLFKGKPGTTSAIQLQKNGTLKEHITKTTALLICIHGFITFEDETNQKIILEPGDYVLINPNVKHWFCASEKSQLVLMK